MEVCTRAVNRLKPRSSQSKNGWKPVTLQAPLLLTVISLMLCVIALLEYLSWVNRRDGALATTSSKFSTSTSFLFLYLPTLLAVLFSILWSWIDLDAKRLEPFFQMSRPEGARPEDSLSLHYPFDFIAWAPVKALRRRHHSVACAGFAMMIVFWAVTPLISSVFTASSVTMSRTGTVVTQKALPALDKQSAALTNSFQLSAYRILWYNEPLPAFTTKEAAFVPFDYQDDGNDALHGENLTARTTQYYTTLDCIQPDITRSDSIFIYDDRRGCNTTLAGLDSDDETNLTALYIGYWTSQYNDFSLDGMGCGDPINEHKFFAWWKMNFGGQQNRTVLSCTPTYWSQETNVTVLRSNLTVVDAKPLEPPKAVAQDVLNTTNFEYVLNSFSPETSRRADIVDTNIDLYQEYRLEELIGNAKRISAHMSEFAIGSTQWQLFKYSDSVALTSAFEKAHRLLFALAFQTLLSDTETHQDSRPGTSISETRAIVIARPLALAVEIALGLVIVFTFILLFISTRRPSQLTCDPASIQDVMNMISSDSCSAQGGEECGARMNRFRAKLDMGHLSFSNSLWQGTAKADAKASRALLTGSFEASHQSNPHTEVRMPWELRAAVGIVFVLLLGAMLAILGALRALVARRGGLSLPSHSSTMNQLLTSYLLVLFPTLLEPFWTLLNRTLCVLEPFKELWKVSAPASKSLDLRYTALPPSLALWRAMRNRHGLLVAVCAIALSANILSITFAGLFNTERTLVVSKTVFPMKYEPKFDWIANSTRSTDPGVFFVAAATMARPELMPAWVANETFLVPFVIPETSVDVTVSQQYRGRTQGFSVDVKCEKVELNTTAYISSHIEGGGPPQVALKSGRTCENPFSKVLGGQNNSNSALEVFNILKARGDGADSEDQRCNDSFLAGFLHANLSVSQDNVKTDNAQPNQLEPDILAVNSLASVWMVCEQKLLVAPYDATVNDSGHVIESERNGPYATDHRAYLSTHLNESFFMNQTRQIFTLAPNVVPYWHNDSFVDTWFGYFIKLQESDQAITDPSKTLPSFEQIAPLVQNAWRRIFAIQLGLNERWLAPPDSGQTISGAIIQRQNRLFMGEAAFIISVVLLLCNMIVATAFFLKRPQRMLQLPITVGRIIELFEGSGLLLEARGNGGLDETVKVGYGRFMGVDGLPHVGIERRPFVVPGDESYLGTGH